MDVVVVAFELVTTIEVSLRRSTLFEVAPTADFSGDSVACEIRPRANSGPDAR